MRQLILTIVLLVGLAAPALAQLNSTSYCSWSNPPVCSGGGSGNGNVIASGGFTVGHSVIANSTDGKQVIDGGPVIPYVTGTGLAVNQQCTVVGQIYFDLTNLATSWCTQIGNPGTWGGLVTPPAQNTGTGGTLIYGPEFAWKIPFADPNFAAMHVSFSAQGNNAGNVIPAIDPIGDWCNNFNGTTYEDPRYIAFCLQHEYNWAPLTSTATVADATLSANLTDTLTHPYLQVSSTATWPAGTITTPVSVTGALAGTTITATTTGIVVGMWVADTTVQGNVPLDTQVVAVPPQSAAGTVTVNKTLTTAAADALLFSATPTVWLCMQHVASGSCAAGEAVQAHVVDSTHISLDARALAGTAALTNLVTGDGLYHIGTFQEYHYDFLLPWQNGFSVHPYFGQYELWTGAASFSLTTSKANLAAGHPEFNLSNGQMDWTAFGSSIHDPTGDNVDQWKNQTAHPPDPSFPTYSYGPYPETGVAGVISGSVACTYGPGSGPVENCAVPMQGGRIVMAEGTGSTPASGESCLPVAGKGMCCTDSAGVQRCGNSTGTYTTTLNFPGASCEEPYYVGVLGDSTSASTTVANLTSIKGIQPGMTIFGPALGSTSTPYTIATVASLTGITLSSSTSVTTMTQGPLSIGPLNARTTAHIPNVLSSQFIQPRCIAATNTNTGGLVFDKGMNGNPVSANYPYWTVALPSDYSFGSMFLTAYFRLVPSVSPAAAADFTQVVLSSTMVGANSAVIPFTSTTGVIVGQSVAGTGIPAGEYVVSFVANTSVTVTTAFVQPNATENVTFTDSSDWYFGAACGTTTTDDTAMVNRFGAITIAPNSTGAAPVTPTAATLISYTTPTTIDAGCNASQILHVGFFRRSNNALDSNTGGVALQGWTLSYQHLTP